MTGAGFGRRKCTKEERKKYSAGIERHIVLQNRGSVREKRSFLTGEVCNEQRSLGDPDICSFKNKEDVLNLAVNTSCD